MGEKFLRVFFLQLFLLRFSFANIEPTMTACIDNYELRFFCKLKYFNDAKKACKEAGSYLVKVDNANMTETINNVVDRINCSNKKFHLGATATKRVWKWLGGDKVYLRGESGYHNWKDGQPNDIGFVEDCLRIHEDNKQWVDSPCTGPEENRPYICQKNLTPNIKIIEMGDDASKCSETSGNCVYQVNWRRNNKAVLSLQNHSVYQVFSAGSSVLHYQNATIRDEGEYSCVTWVRQNRANQVSASTNINVNGSPIINKIDPSPCNSSLMINWRPHPRALGFPHRITVIDSKSEDQVGDILLTPTEDVEQVTEIKDLVSLTVYHIHITACINESLCTNHSANATATSLGITVKNANLYQVVDNNTCIITWNWPYNISTDFKVSLNTSLSFNTSKVHASLNKTDNEFTYSFEPYPKQVYEVQIQSGKNSKLCPFPVRAVGSCKGETRTTTVQTTASKITDIIIPTSAAGGAFVLLVIILTLICWKRKSRRNEMEVKENPIYGVTDKVADESDYDNLHSTSKQRDGKNNATKDHTNDRKPMQNDSSEMVVNPLYGDVDLTTNFDEGVHESENQENATAAPVYAAVVKVRKKQNLSSQAYASASFDASTNEDAVYAVVDKKK